MENAKNNYVGWIVLVVLVGAALLTTMFLVRPRPVAAELDGFAQCLAEKKITMYGAYWCSHCKNEKAAFGDSFRFVPYVECTADVKKCTDAGINGYPTWIFPDGRKFEGEQGVKRLSELSGCALPE
ncbi:MAG: hypothetical protein A3C08_02605 [Candidatus Taylorbacteria bacterium RIFCSPHIGHO2_02_FULL_47_18]|uniref:Thioredoxin domain-containing protein n=1 Tax=Candidatus Taylorbacteria bacterium RIFCSPLOWO2_01_FULL_48_100 TaxID=1802322 RepID=A0A1G2NE13_9BACT|nr:MAG: hypothetical protein A2670_02315 [Candidatus Taylorbacteria bacterium RIFCSPHIGHO2_01_FULL_48_38]OHA27591.1 MAG: hypothetical protein A3C08_02605 [Candidatus Taylorbacteria bacterium RIFCSPHIGHO2_02_FULL_47_18]OHA34283.1 MAG: hypothetical protein A2938_01990 [Candidatus Taylorbacteria bacterium RIFCSPLOWO2_01_FULL_48_100]OHA40437.1 MAG: hypothetical protein A3J31_02625 [Candidatus Taylorbacteria bacterium RIFCSPLOWO2_02_FULL_48_16]OHA44922.1 MAG: hypothetical protein A3H13_03400 [Candid